MGIIDAVWMLMDAVKGLVEAASRVDVGPADAVKCNLLEATQA